jgi:hypothetical protein
VPKVSGSRTSIRAVGGRESAVPDAGNRQIYGEWDRT